MTQKRVAFDFVTNDWEHSAKDIACLYRDRWEIEKFFRRLKQNLKIKSFVGTSQNGVLVQIWTSYSFAALGSA